MALKGHFLLFFRAFFDSFFMDLNPSATNKTVYSTYR